MLGSCWLNPPNGEDVHPVRGPGPDATAAVGPYYFCSRCWFHDREGLACAMFLHSRCCTQSWEILGESHLSADRFSLGKYTRRPLNYTKHLLMK